MNLLDILKELSEKPVSWVIFQPGHGDQGTALINDSFRATDEKGRIDLLLQIISLWQKIFTGQASREEKEIVEQLFGRKFLEIYCEKKFFIAVREGDRYSLFTIRLCPPNLTVNGGEDIDRIKQTVRESPILLEVHGRPKAVSVYLDALDGLAERINF